MSIFVDRDAYCPHLGAHLGAGGRVEGECIRCPFHGWTFKGGDGRLANIPYSDTRIIKIVQLITGNPLEGSNFLIRAYLVPEFAKIKMWKTMEGNGFIYLWFHAEGEEPSWFPYLYPEIQSGSWKYRGRSELQVACHVQVRPDPESAKLKFHLGIA